MSSKVYNCDRCGVATWGRLCKSCYQRQFAKDYPRKILKDDAVTHGTLSGYRRGCRCQPCTTANTSKREARKKRQRERERYENKRHTTITVSWKKGVDRAQAEEISRHVAKEIGKFKWVDKAQVVGTPSERGTRQPLHTARGSAGEEQPDRPATRSDRHPRSERVSGNGDLDLLKVPSFKSRGKGKSLVEVVSQLTERS